MFELLVLVLFCWIFFGSIRLIFKVAWGMTKILAVILFVVALPTLIVGLLFAGGIVLLLPLILIAFAWVILKICI